MQCFLLFIQYIWEEKGTIFKSSFTLTIKHRYIATQSLCTSYNPFKEDSQHSITEIQVLKINKCGKNSLIPDVAPLYIYMCPVWCKEITPHYSVPFGGSC